MNLPRRLSEPGPVIRYLLALRGMDKSKHDAAIAAARKALSGVEGRILLDLLDKSTLEIQHPVGVDPSALVASNAQSLIASDLRRLMSDELEQVYERQADARSRHGRGTGNPGRSSGGGAG
jgi:hypothetical protein